MTAWRAGLWHAPAAARIPPAAAVAAARERYLQRLLAHIDSHKFYPHCARRRSLEGEIHVSFQLLADGAIRALAVTGGSRVLRHVAEQAVQAARPLPPPDGMELQAPISFVMVFRLGLATSHGGGR